MPDAPHPTAQDISQRLLDQTRAAYLNDDFDGFADCFRLPRTTSTFEGDRKMTRREDLLSVFEGVRTHLAAIGADDMLRSCIAAEYTAPDRIQSTNITHVMRKGLCIEEQIPCFSVVVLCEDGKWRVTDAQYAMESTGYARAILGTNSVADGGGAQPDRPAAPEPAPAGAQRPEMATYQAWLDEISRALWTGAFDRISELTIYPHRMRTRDAQVVHDGPEGMKEAAREFRTFLTRVGAQSFHRICTHARMHPDGDRIDGRHTTYILRGGFYAIPPFENEMTLVHDGGAWKSAGLSADVDNATVTLLSPSHLAAALARPSH